MLHIEKGQLVRIGTSGEDVRGVVIEVDEQRISVVYDEKIIQVDRSKIETIRRYTPTSESTLIILGAGLFLTLIVVGVFIGWVTWG